MVLPLKHHLIGLSFCLALSTSSGMAAEPAEVETFVKARIEIGEMMMDYFKGGERFGEGQRPSPEQMKQMGEEIQAKLASLLSKHNLTVEEYRRRGPEIFTDEEAVSRFLDEHPDLKRRYEALPLDRIGRGGGARRY